MWAFDLVHEIFYFINANHKKIFNYFQKYCIVVHTVLILCSIINWVLLSFNLYASKVIKIIKLPHPSSNYYSVYYKMYVFYFILFSAIHFYYFLMCIYTIFLNFLFLILLISVFMGNLFFCVNITWNPLYINKIPVKIFLNYTYSSGNWALNHVLAIIVLMTTSTGI